MTPVAGTTRDVIETAVNIGGFPVVLSDTAGLRQSDDVVEIEGIRRALDRYSGADNVCTIKFLNYLTLLKHSKIQAKRSYHTGRRLIYLKYPFT